MREEHPRLEAVVQAVVLLEEVVDVAVGLVVGEVTAVVHPGRALGELVVARVVALGGAGRSGYGRGHLGWEGGERVWMEMCR